jgi:hypothetical protein
VITAEFEEKAYEGPLYNQLERGNNLLFTPGQVLEKTLGFDAGLFVAQAAIWETLGYKTPLQGAALAYYDWPFAWKLKQPKEKIPRFRLNLFLQAKRPDFYTRRPRSLKKLNTISAPLWSFRVTRHQQRRLQRMSETLEGKAHVAYASPAFHTYTDLFRHTQRRTMVQNSSFPSVEILKDHDAWYYQRPGAQGAANPNPESIEEPSLLDRIAGLARATDAFDGGDLRWLDLTARGVIDAAAAADEVTIDGRTAHFFDDLQTLERLTERYEIPESLRAYARVALFTIRFDLNWLVVADV